MTLHASVQINLTQSQEFDIFTMLCHDMCTIAVCYNAVRDIMTWEDMIYTEISRGVNFDMGVHTADMAINPSHLTLDSRHVEYFIFQRDQWQAIVKLRDRLRLWNGFFNVSYISQISIVTHGRRWHPNFTCEQHTGMYSIGSLLKGNHACMWCVINCNAMQFNSIRQAFNWEYIRTRCQ